MPPRQTIPTIPSKMKILVPLYIYPSPQFVDDTGAVVSGAWECISTYSTVDFIIVVNPHNGPGDSLDTNYIRDIRKLNSYPNVVVLGYVSTAYATRQYSAVHDDVLVYASWRLNDIKIGLQGIFFDETPSQWTAANASFLRNINCLVKGACGLGTEPLVVHNPGAVPNRKLLNVPCSPDIAVVFEASYKTYLEHSCEEALAKLNEDRIRLACIMHSVPQSLMTTHSDVAFQIKQLEPWVGTLFITSQATNLYTKLGDHWEQFIQAISL